MIQIRQDAARERADLRAAFEARAAALESARAGRGKPNWNAPAPSATRALQQATGARASLGQLQAVLSR